jgi:hypothetical protein
MDRYKLGWKGKNKEGKMNRVKINYLLIIYLALVMGLSGCATTGIYSIEINYDPTYAHVPDFLQPAHKDLQSIIHVVEFTDARKLDDPLVIGRVIESSGAKVLVLPRHTRPTMAVAEGVRQYLRKAGYNVSSVGPKWDLQEKTMQQAVTGKLLIGGVIEEMEINCRKSFPTNTYTTKLKMTLYLADSVNKKIVNQVAVQATTSLDHIMFSEGRLGDQAALAIGDAIEKVFEKEELVRAMRQILQR